MPLSSGKAYLEQFGNDPVAQRALLACAAALRLDDESASEAIEIVAQANGRTRELLHEVKNLGCVWRQWDGSWYLAEDVRKELVDELYHRVPHEQISKLRSRLADKADHRAAAMLPDGQITAHRLRTVLLEAGYQRAMDPNQVEEGGEQLGAIWENAAPSAGEATARSVDYLAPEIEEHVGQLPVQVLFLRGMAARTRHDRADQEKYFRAVWERGRPGYIFGAAAHFFGILVRDHRMAEQALRDSVRWNYNPRNKAQAYHSLGNLLAGNFRRARDAEYAFRQSLQLDPVPAGKAQVWHSLGNLLAKNRHRSREAEEAIRRSIGLNPEPYSEGQAYHSLANLLARDRRRAQEAENAYRKSLDLLHDAPSQAQVWHSLGNLLAKDRHRSREAEIAYKKSVELDSLDSGKAQVWHSLGHLLTKDPTRWRDAEDAYQKSLELRHDAPHQSQVNASLANHLSTFHESEADDRAENVALRGLELSRGDPKTSGVCYRVLADVYERRGDFTNAINALESLMKTNRQLGERKFERSIRNRIASLRRSASNERPDTTGRDEAGAADGNR